MNEENRGLSPEELELEQGHNLPDREAMSLIDPGGSLGPPPLTEVDPEVYSQPIEPIE